MRKFDYSFLKLGMVPAELIDVTNGINSFDLGCTVSVYFLKPYLTKMLVTTPLY